MLNSRLDPKAGRRGILTLTKRRVKWGLISKLLMRAFSWHPWIPGTLKLDSILSLFKCARDIWLLLLSVQCQTLCDFGVGDDVGGPDVCLEEGLLAKVVTPGEESDLLLLLLALHLPGHPNLTLADDVEHVAVRTLQSQSDG